MKMKRYRLKIPEMIKRKNAIIAADFEAADEVIEFGGPADNIPGYECVEARGGIVAQVPKDWLEEIKDKPVSAEEWGIATYGNTAEIQLRNFNTLEMVGAFKAGEANNELRHQPKQTFKEWWKYSKPADFNEENKIGAEEVWIAAIGSYGFKEDYGDPG